MKIKYVLAVALAFVSLFVLSTFLSYQAVGAIGDPSEFQVFLYEHTNYGGNTMSFSVGQSVADLRQWKFLGSKTNWNDKISSMKIGKFAKIIFYDNINYDKKLSEIEGDGYNVKYVPSLHVYNWGDKISSFQVVSSSKFK